MCHLEGEPFEQAMQRALVVRAVHGRENVHFFAAREVEGDGRFLVQLAGQIDEAQHVEVVGTEKVVQQPQVGVVLEFLQLHDVEGDAQWVEHGLDHAPVLAAEHLPVPAIGPDDHEGHAAGVPFDPVFVGVQEAHGRLDAEVVAEAGIEHLDHGAGGQEDVGQDVRIGGIHAQGRGEAEVGRVLVLEQPHEVHCVDLDGIGLFDGDGGSHHVGDAVGRDDEAAPVVDDAGRDEEHGDECLVLGQPVVAQRLVEQIARVFVELHLEHIAAILAIGVASLLELYPRQKQVVRHDGERDGVQQVFGDVVEVSAIARIDGFALQVPQVQLAIVGRTHHAARSAADQDRVFGEGTRGDAVELLPHVHGPQRRLEAATARAQHDHVRQRVAFGLPACQPSVQDGFRGVFVSLCIFGTA